MYALQHTGQLSIEEFHSPLGGKLVPSNRWVSLHKVISWMSLESHYAPQFTTKTGTPAKPFQMAFGAVYIQRRLGVTDRETVALRLPPANGCDPFGIGGCGADIYPIRRWRCAYLRLMAWIPPGSGEVVRTIYPTGGGADRRWRCAHGDPEVAMRVR
jgi:hypothetical protein